MIVLLHVYPEFWYGWHRTIPALVDAGYRVLVPDQRGYNRSEKPDRISSYRRRELAADVADLVASSGRDSAHIVEHDWGAVVAWDVALRHPETVDRLGIVNVPHPTVFERALQTNPRQMLKSWYMFFFQLPRIPERYQRRGNLQRLIDSFRTANEGTFTKTDFERYRAAWDRDRGLTGMLNWYRALFRHSTDPPRERVTAPTLVIWGERDPYLLPEMASQSVEYCENGRLELMPDATHWVHDEYPERVNDHILSPLSSTHAEAATQ